MLSWARQRSGLDVGTLAKKVPVHSDRLAAWERGDEEDRPTFRQAQRLADQLHIPFGYLFLDSPPSEEMPLPDLRTRHGLLHLQPSPDFLEVLYDALRKQEWYRDYLREQDAVPLPFIGKYSVQTASGVIANDIKRTLSINDDLRRGADDNDHYFRLLVQKCEDARIAVLRNSVVGNNTHRPLSSEEFQGFAMADPIAPLVFVNQKDYLSAQIFTLLHEIAHLWLGDTGVSDPEYLNAPDTVDNVNQRLADQVAADVLVPVDDFSLRWDSEYGSDIGSRLDRLRRYFKVSAFVLLRRAYELQKVTFQEYREEYDAQRAQIKPKSATGGGGGYSTILSRNSKMVSAAVLRSVRDGSLALGEGATLLNVRSATLYDLRRHWEVTSP